MKKLCCLIVVSILCAFTLSAQSWEKVYSLDGCDCYIYTNITNSYSGHIVWFKDVYTTKAARASVTREVESKRTIFEMKRCVIYDSDWSQSRIRSIIHYGYNGKLINSFDLDDYYQDWSMVVPGSMGEIERDAARYFAE